MENEQYQDHQPIAPEPAVSFPSPRPTQESNGFPKWIFAVIGLVIILAGGGFFLYQSSNAPQSASPTPTPYISGIDTLPTPTVTPVVTSTPIATSTPAASPSATQRSGVSIEVQNGTGTTGDAALAKSALTKAGYTKVTTGNATNQSSTETTIIYSSDVPLAVVSEITSALSTSFNPVRSQSGSGKMTVTVITGPKGSTQATVRPSSTPTASAKASATVKPTATP